MNHHMAQLPHGQPPMPQSRRRQDFPFNHGHPNMNSPPYMGYPPHMNGINGMNAMGGMGGMNGMGMNGMNGHMPPTYSQQFQPWYPPYGQMQYPPRPYQPQPPYGPMIVSSYPPSQPIMAPNHMPPHSMPMQPRAATPLQPVMSPSVHANPLPAELQDLSGPSPLNNIPAAPPSPIHKEPEAPPPFVPPLPWLSVPEQPFPPRRQTKRRPTRQLSSDVEFPLKDGQWFIGEKPAEEKKAKPEDSTANITSGSQTPTISAPQPAADPTTNSPSPKPTAFSPTINKGQTEQKSTKPAIPVVPVVPNVPGTPRRQANKDTSTSSVGSETPKSSAAGTTDTEQTSSPSTETSTKAASPARAPPKSWADLVRSKAAAAAAAAAGRPTSAPVAAESGAPLVQKSESLGDVLGSLGEDVSQYSDKIGFLEPRGLVNTGNMCYMNSVLQILVSCVPFYQFLDYVGRRAVHSFQSDVPLIDSLIMFMREFRVIDAATSEDQLRLRLKPTELEQYGESFVPEFVYEMIRQLPRFRDMRRGHQQDAQEFLGFLLEELHEECDRAAKHTSKNAASEESTDGSADGWLEVGAKQKSAVTQSSGAVATESPVTRIFGGKLRSEFKVPGNKTSVTMEPYQPLQLDIGAPDVHNIIDALRGLTKPESIQGDFNSSRGPNVTATKQMFIETLPPVLILHLKRFQYDSLTGATQKIWKKVGYPLDLEIPREVFPAHRRNAMNAQGGLPKYRLMGVIYHHGKNASGGHYTVDVRRQDGREWIRMDDTVLRRVRSEDVAEAGGEEDPKVLAAALEQHNKQDKNARANIFENIDQDEMDSMDSDKGWSQVNGHGSTNGHTKKSVNGAAPSSGPSSGVRTPLGRYGSRDNKVAYLLFYQRMA
ncbi:hypothetical protein N7532_009024 [Penicillium argentinense]|uniref:Ubiquitin carboxyl-terminal hydrolase n=1 Tax=Penicillium argentinense TaxID=1131581 RepID=A0A9W9EYT8_9EURO|nr:uncharacterized protein N7532_009024 [Penicillium argentinense]KAJ5090340.1 hypothetical protein N7532_009024 [Penicillium argentinense]